MTWRYAIVRQTKNVALGKKRKIVHWYDVYEVYLNKRGKATSWSADPINLQANETLAGLRFQFSRIIADSYGYPIMEFKGKKLVVSKRQAG